MIKLKNLTEKQILDAAWFYYEDRWLIALDRAKERNFENKYLNKKMDSLYEIVKELGELILELDNKAE